MTHQEMGYMIYARFCLAKHPLSSRYFLTVNEAKAVCKVHVELIKENTLLSISRGMATYYDMEFWDDVLEYIDKK